MSPPWSRPRRRSETIYGLLLVLFIIFLPAGIWGSLGRGLGRSQATRPA